MCYTCVLSARDRLYTTYTTSLHLYTAESLLCTGYPTLGEDNAVWLIPPFFHFLSTPNPKLSRLQVLAQLTRLQTLCYTSSTSQAPAKVPMSCTEAFLK